MTGKVLLNIVAVSVLLCTVFSHVKRQYHFVYDQKNMTEALKYCKEKHTDLATIDNMEDVKTLNDMANLSKMVFSEGKYTAWIGMYDDVNSWRWSLADRSFYKDGETEFRKWCTEEPNNQNSGEQCTQMYDNGCWNDEHCEDLVASVCFDARGPNETFVLVNKSMNWTEAQSHCRAHHTNLASVRNETENQKIQKLIPTGQKVWIGLFRDSWKWSDGSNSSFRYWQETTREPNNHFKNESCVSADFSHFGKWEDWSCNWTRAFICYSHVTTKQVIRLSLMSKSSSVGLKEPAVMTEILTQLKQRLANKGVSEHIRLSWRKQSDGKIVHEE